LIAEDIETDTPVRIDVGMINPRREVYLWRFEGVICWEMDCEKEDAAGIWTVTGSHDGCLPVEQVIPYRSGTAARRRIPSEVGEFFIDALESHVLCVV